MDLFSSGFNRTLRGFRTGDRNSIVSGALLLALAVWQRNRKKSTTRELVARETVKKGETLVIRSTMAGESERRQKRDRA